MSIEKPTIWGNGSYKPSAKCPQCALIMHLKNQCPHCHYWLTDFEKRKQQYFWKQQKRASILKGIVLFPALLLLLYVVFTLFLY
jgi:hypothetical protein